MSANQNSSCDVKSSDQQHETTFEPISKGNSAVSDDDNLFQFSGMELRPVVDQAPSGTSILSNTQPGGVDSGMKKEDRNPSPHSSNQLESSVLPRTVIKMPSLDFSGMELRPVVDQAPVGASTLHVNEDRNPSPQGLNTLESTTATAVPALDFSGMELRPVVVDGGRKDERTPVPPTDTPEHPELVAPSGVAGAVVGLLLGGPIVAAVAGFGSAYAVRKEGSTGDVARALGEVALSVKATGQELEEKHHILSNAQRSIQEADSDLAVKVKNFMQTTWKTAVELNEEHNILQRGVEGTGKGLEYLSEKIKSMSKKDNHEDD